MDESDKWIVVGAATLILFFGVMVVINTHPITVTGEVTAMREDPTFNTVTIFMKTLNGADSALYVNYQGTGDEVQIGRVYRISVGWWGQLLSVEEIV